MPANSIPALIVNVLIWVGIFGAVFLLYRWYKKKKLEVMFKKGDDKNG